jgi:hypothetical protein
VLHHSTQKVDYQKISQYPCQTIEHYHCPHGQPNPPYDPNFYFMISWDNELDQKPLECYLVLQSLSPPPWPIIPFVVPLSF